MLDNNNLRIAELIKAGIESSGISRAELARRCEVTPQAINGWLKTGRIAKTKIPLIAQILGIPMLDLLQHTAAEPNAHYEVEGKPLAIVSENIPVVGTAQLGDNGHWSEYDYPVGQGDGFVQYPTKDRNAYALRVKGDSMRPRIKPGEFVIIEPHTAPIPGSEVIVKTKDGRVMVKVLDFRRDGIIQLSSVNENHGPITLDEDVVELVHCVAGIVKASLYRREQN